MRWMNIVDARTGQQHVFARRLKVVYGRAPKESRPGSFASIVCYLMRKEKWVMLNLDLKVLVSIYGVVWCA